MSDLRTEFRNTAFADDDFRQVLGEIEEMDAEAETIMASARGKVQGIRKRQKNRKKIAKSELGIPGDVLNAVLKQRKLETQLKRISEEVADELIELYEDCSGQFSLFASADGEAPAETAAQAAARQRKAEIAAVSEREQAEGAAALDELSGDKVH
ncbi:MAG: hypothetical protein WD472_11305 [Dehalococcoidia bacterium]